MATEQQLLAFVAGLTCDGTCSLLLDSDHMHNKQCTKPELHNKHLFSMSETNHAFLGEQMSEHLEVRTDGGRDKLTVTCDSDWDCSAKNETRHNWNCSRTARQRR